MIEEQPVSTEPLALGDIATFSYTASSIPSPTVIWFRGQPGMETPLVNDNDIVVITEQVNGDSVMSTLQLRLVNEMDFTDYFCRGDNGFNTTDSDIVQVVPAPVVIEEQPVSTPPLLLGDVVTFSCAASSIPSPSITWFQGQPGIETPLVNDDDIIIITVEANNNLVRSTLQLTLVNEMDFTDYFCRGDNGLSTTDSNVFQAVRLGKS